MYILNITELKKIIEKQKNKEGALLPVLHSINDYYGFIDKKAIPIVAAALNLSEAEVYGVITFYHDFKNVLPTKNIIKLCMAEACQSMGCDSLFEEISNHIKHDADTSIQKIYCLGNCSLSPAAIINEKYYGRLNFSKVIEILEDANK